MNTQNIKEDVFKSELKFHALLNDDQIATVLKAIDGEFVTEEHVQELLDTDTLDKQDKCNTLIEHVIVPFNMSNLNSDIRQKLDNGEVQYVVVGGSEETPSFIYTVGGLDKVGAEYLYVGPISSCGMAKVLAKLLQENMEADRLVTDIGRIGTMGRVGSDIRYRIIEVPLYKLVNNYLKMVAAHYEDDRLHAPVYILETGDDNNILPGEEGYDTTFRQFSDVSDLEYTVVS